MVLGATTEEEQEIGETLAQCLDTLPEPITNVANKGGPWIKLSAQLGGAILRRIGLIKHLQEAARTQAVETRQTQGHEQAQANGWVPPSPPQPMAVETPREVPPEGRPDVIAPEPIAMGGQTIAPATNGTSSPHVGGVWAPEPVSYG